MRKSLALAVVKSVLPVVKKPMVELVNKSPGPMEKSLALVVTKGDGGEGGCPSATPCPASAKTCLGGWRLTFRIWCEARWRRRTS